MQSKVNTSFRGLQLCLDCTKTGFDVLKEPDMYSYSIFLHSQILVLNNLNDKTMKPTQNNPTEINASLEISFLISLYWHPNEISDIWCIFS